MSDYPGLTTLVIVVVTFVATLIALPWFYHVYSAYDDWVARIYDRKRR